jgi:hypothetical protein
LVKPLFSGRKWQKVLYVKINVPGAGKKRYFLKLESSVAEPEPQGVLPFGRSRSRNAMRLRNTAGKSKFLDVSFEDFLMKIHQSLLF